MIEVAAVQGEDETGPRRVAAVYRVTSVEGSLLVGLAARDRGARGSSASRPTGRSSSREAFATLAADGAEARWRAEPDTAGIGLDELGSACGSGSLRSKDTLHSAGGPAAGLGGAQTGLGGALERADRSLLVSRSGVLVPSVQLAVLAGAALLFLAGLLAERRSVESAILRSRGASAGEVGQLALREGALLVVPRFSRRRGWPPCR